MVLLISRNDDDDDDDDDAPFLFNKCDTYGAPYRPEL